MRAAGRRDGAGGRNLTRGEFLAAAGATLAGGVVGCATPGGAATGANGGTAAGAASQAAMSLECCGPGMTDWLIPASVLNIVWSDVWPREVANTWNGGGFEEEVLGRDVRDWLPVKIPSLGTSSAFAERAALAVDYLDKAAGAAPITLIGEGAWDFILSDDGIEIFAPPRLSVADDADKRNAQIELLRFYTFRRTGVGAMGLPTFMDRSTGAVTIDSPTGPSQVDLSEAVLSRIFVGRSCEWSLEPLLPTEAESEVQSETISVPPDAFEAIQIRPHLPDRIESIAIPRGTPDLRDYLGRSGVFRRLGLPQNTSILRTRLNAPVTMNDLAALGQTGPGGFVEIPSRFVVVEQPPPGDGVDVAPVQVRRGVPLIELPCVQERLGWEERMTGERRLRVDVATYMHLVQHMRCWQVSGAVYRAMMTELPRIIATMWLEKAQECDTVETSYTVMFKAGTTEDEDGCRRRIFAERLESSLPPPERMRFDVRDEPPPAGEFAPEVGTVNLWDPLDVATPRPPFPLWNVHDVMITNAGFCLPKPGDPPDAESMLVSIGRGDAGNPVFTDTRDCI